MRSYRALQICLWLIFGIASGLTATTAGARGSTGDLDSSAHPSGQPINLLNDLAEALKKLNELQQALTEANKGEIPSFDTPLGALAERIDKIADAIDKQASVSTVPVKSAHHPGSAIAELTTSLEALRTQQINQKQLQGRLLVERDELRKKEAAAARLSEALEKLSSSPIVLPEMRPGVHALWLDSDHLHLAISSCLTSLTRMQKSLDSQLSVLTTSISNLQYYLDDPQWRSAISAIDESNASLSKQVNKSIETSKTNLANRDSVTIKNNREAMQQSGAPSAQPPRRPSGGPPTMPPLPLPRGGCPAGYKEVGGHCVKLEIIPH